MLIREGVFGEGVMGDVGNPLKAPCFRLDYFSGNAGDLGDVAHRWGDTLCVKDSA